MLAKKTPHNEPATALAGGTPLARACAGLAALAVAMGIGRFAFTPILPMMQHDAALSISAGGLLASANYFGYLVGALSAVFLRLAPERAIRRGLLSVTIVTIAMGFPLPFAAWLVLRFLAGVTSAWLLISVSAWALETLAVYQRPLLNSMVFAGVGTGIAAAGLICLALVGAGAASTQAWFALGGLAAAVTLLIWPAFKGQHRSPEREVAKHGAYVWDGVSIRLVICYGVTGFGYIIPATFLPVMAKAALKGSPLFGWSWPVFGVAAALSTLMAASLARRFGNRRVWMASHFVMAGGIVLPALWPNLFSILAAAICVGGTFMVVTLTALQEARRVARRDATMLIAAMTSSFAAGQIIGPLTVSAGLGNGDFSLAMEFAALMLSASALLLTEHQVRSHPATEKLK